MKKIKWKNIIGWTIAALVAGFIVYSNMQEQKALQNSGKKNVYAVLPLSGPVATVGKDLKAAMDAWQKVTPDMPFNLIYLDSESQPLKAVTATQQAILNEKEPLVITALSPVSAAVMPVVAKQGGFSFGINTTDASKLEQNGHFQLVASGLAEDEKTLYPYIAKNYKKIAIAYTNEELGKLSLLQTKEFMNRHGVEVVAEIPLEMSVPDVKIEALKAIKSGADAIVVYGQATLSYANFCKELKKYDEHPVILAAIQFSVPFVLDVLGDNRNDIIFESIDLADMSKDKFKQFHKEMDAKGLPVYLCSAYAFNVLEVIKYALDNNMTLSQDAFQKLNTFDGLGGKIYFMGKGASQYSYHLTQYKDGKVVPVEE